MKQKNKLIVVALGGNALLRTGEKGTIEEQEAHSAETCKHLLSLIKKDYNIVITHGNGPQVGAILLRNETAKDVVPVMPLDVCVADSQGSIGYIIQQALLNHLRMSKTERYVVTMITQVIVEPNDPAFNNPTKPIGPFYSKEESEKLKKEKKWAMIHDANRGYRRVVPSPKPVKTIQRIMVKRLAEQGHIVVASGGGGIPIWKNAANGGEYRGMEAVIDKDLASALLACEIQADMLIILTGVEKVALNFGKPNQKLLDTVKVSDAKKYLKDGHFGIGSMAPKIEAAIDFIEKTGHEVLITMDTSLENALEGKTGTRIVPDVNENYDIQTLFSEKMKNEK
ncbi:MAG: carbamate kinase [Planctomycetes bacterium]|nr:carbamate kinase [Planctomycetota bacterium]